MGVLIDASVLIEFERGNLDLPAMIASGLIWRPKVD